MNVSIKEFGVSMQVKTTGIEFEVSDTKGNFLGDFIVTKTNLIWCKGKTTRDNGVKIPWDKFIERMGAA